MGNICSTDTFKPSGGGGGGKSGVKVDQEFDFRLKNLKSLKKSFEVLLNNIKVSSESLRDVPVKLSGVGEGYVGVCACLNHSGSGVSEAAMLNNNNNDDDENNNNNNNGEDDCEANSQKEKEISSVHKKTDVDTGVHYKDRFENINIQTIDREVAQEDYQSSQALTATFLKIRETEYIKFSNNINEKVIVKIQDLQKELDQVQKQGQVVTERFNKYNTQRKKKEAIEKDFEKKGKSLSDSPDYTTVSKNCTELDKQYKEGLFEFDKKYEALLVNVQRVTRTSRDDYLDEVEAYLKAVVDPMTVVEPTQ